MNTIQRIVKNTMALYFADMINKVLAFLSLMYTARYLGSDGFGILSLGTAMTGILVVISDPGFSTLMVRDLARDNSLTKKYLGNVITMKALFAVIIFILVVLMMSIFNYPAQTRVVVYLMTLSTIIGSFEAMFNSIFQAYEKLEYMSLVWILNSTLTLAGVLLVISLGLDVVIFAVMYLIVNIILLLYAIFVCAWKFVLPSIKFDWAFSRTTFLEAFPFGLTAAFTAIYLNVDSVLISVLVPRADTMIGLYGAANRLIIFLTFIPSIYFSCVFPVMSRLFITSEGSLRFAFERSFKYMAMIALPIGIGVSMLADRIILLVYGPTYASAGIAMQILVWSTVCIFMSQPFIFLFNSINRQVTVTKITAMGAVANVLLNLFMIPVYGYVGAGITAVLTELFIVVVCFKISSNTNYVVKTTDILKVLSKTTLASLVMGAFIFYFNSNLILTIIGSVIVYVVALLLLRCHDEGDLQLFKRILTFTAH